MPNKPHSLPLLFFALLLTSPIVIFAQTPTLSPSELGKSWEQWVDERPVQGEFETGVMADHTDPIGKLTEFYVQLPSSDFKTLCVQIKSQDSRYYAELPYDIEGQQGGLIKLKLPTKYKTELSEYTSDQLSILSAVCKDFNSPGSRYVLSSWSGKFNSKNIAVNINSPEITRLTVLEGRKAVFKCYCQEIDPESSTDVFFNRRCLIPVEYIGAQFSYKLVSSSGGMTETPVPTPLPLFVR